MSSIREGNQHKKVAVQPKAVSWQEKKSLADNEEKVLQKEIEDLRLWVGFLQFSSFLFLFLFFCFLIFKVVSQIKESKKEIK